MEDVILSMQIEPDGMRESELLSNAPDASEERDVWRAGSESTHAQMIIAARVRWWHILSAPPAESAIVRGSHNCWIFREF